MTIFFVPAHDDETRANFAVAQLIVLPGDITIFAEDATRARLLQALADNPTDRNVFSMSHGSTLVLCGHNKLPALSDSDGHLLAEYNVFAMACWTGVTLGHILAQSNTTWWGYDKAITAPDDRTVFSHILADIVATAKAGFVTGTDISSVVLVLDSIKTSSLRAIQALDDMGAPNFEDFFGPYSFCNQLWQRLSVWLPGAQAPLRHPDAPVAFFDL